MKIFFRFFFVAIVIISIGLNSCNREKEFTCNCNVYSNIEDSRSIEHLVSQINKSLKEKKANCTFSLIAQKQLRIECNDWIYLINIADLNAEKLIYHIRGEEYGTMIILETIDNNRVIDVRTKEDKNTTLLFEDYVSFSIYPSTDEYTFFSEMCELLCMIKKLPMDN